MAFSETMVWVLILVVAIEGIWLAGLIYLMWRKAQRGKAAPEAEAPVTKST
ncbi:MAG TPA: hypothetical protein VJ397_03895 [Thermoplasmata archaeon]|nr:hypothetical protein [Thermoplasmata archaeon]